jgi:hypothetical protein
MQVYRPIRAPTIDLGHFVIDGLSSYTFCASATFVHMPLDMSRSSKLSILQTIKIFRDGVALLNSETWILSENCYGDNIGSNWGCYPPCEVAKNL